MSDTFQVQGKDLSKCTISIDEGIEKINDEKRSRVDIECPIKHMRLGLNEDSQIVVEYIDGREFVPTEHALRQMATWMHVPHGFLNTYREPVCKPSGEIKFQRDRHDAEVLLNVFKNGIRDGRVDSDKDFRFRTYTDGTLRAMLSDRYNVIDNTWYMRVLQETFKKIGGDEPRLHRWRGDADTIYGNMLLPDSMISGEDSDYGGMISLSNCEIGIRRLGLIPAIFRGICSNGVVYGKEKGIAYTKVHRGKAELSDIASDIFINLNVQIPEMSKGLAAFLATRDMKWVEDVQARNIFAQLAIDAKLTTGANGQSVAVVSEFTANEANNHNLFGLINAITRASQGYNNEESAKLDEFAGSMMLWNKTQWNNFNMRAKSLDTQVRDKVFGIVAA